MKLRLLIAVIPLLCGCSGVYTKTPAQMFCPAGASYTYARERITGVETDYFGISWNWQ